MQAWNWDAAQVQAQAAAAASYASAQGFQPAANVVPPNLTQAQLGYQQYYATTLPAVTSDLTQQQLEAQQQHWQQWQQWQQQYQQWQQEYGDKYQASLNALSAQGVAAPSAASVAQPPPLPPPDKPPPPPEDNRSDGFQAQKRQQEDFSAEPGKKPRYPYEATRGRGGGGRGGRGGRWGAPVNVQTVEPEKVPEPKKEAPDELSEAEKAFDIQFQQWEQQFSEWKAQNINHPDKNQYREYEAKWRDWREKLLQRRVQMKKKREASVAAKPPEQQQPLGPGNKGRADWSNDQRNNDQRYNDDQRPNEQRGNVQRPNDQHSNHANNQQGNNFHQDVNLPAQDLPLFPSRSQQDIKEPDRPGIKSLLDIPLGFMAEQAKGLLGSAPSDGVPEDKSEQFPQNAPKPGQFNPQQTKINFNRIQQDRSQGNFGKTSGLLPKPTNNRNVLNFPKTFQISSDICKVIESQGEQPDAKNEMKEDKTKMIGPELPPQVPQGTRPEVIDITEEKKQSPNYDFLKKSSDGIPGLDLFNDKPLFGEQKGPDTPNSNSQNSSVQFGQDSSTSQDNGMHNLGPGVQTSQGQGFQFPKIQSQAPPDDKDPKDSSGTDPFVNEDAQHGFSGNSGPGAQQPQGFNKTGAGMPGNKALNINPGIQGPNIGQGSTPPKFGGGNQMPNFPLNPGQNFGPGSQGPGFNQGPIFNPGMQGHPFNSAKGPNVNPGLQDPHFNPGNQGPNFNPNNQGPNFNPGNQGPNFNSNNQGSNFNPGNQGPNFNPGNQGPNFNPGNQGPNFNTGNQGPNVIPGNQGPNFNPNNQGPSFNPGSKGPNFNPNTNNQGPNFNPGNQGPNFNPGKQGPNFNPNNQGPNFNHGNQGPNFNPNNQGPNFNPGNQGPNFNPGKQGPNVNPGTQGPNFNPNNQGPNFNPNNQGPNFNPNNQGPNFNPNNQGPNFNPGKQGPNFNPGKQGPNFNPNNQGPSFNPGNQGPNFNPGNQGPKFNANNQGSNFNPNNQGSNFNSNNQGPNFNPANQSPSTFEQNSPLKFGTGNFSGVGGQGPSMGLGKQNPILGNRTQNPNIGTGNNPNFRPGNQAPNFGQRNEENPNNDTFAMNRSSDNQSVSSRDGMNAWGNQQDHSQDEWTDNNTPWSQGGPLSDHNQSSTPGNFSGPRDFDVKNQSPQVKGNGPGGNFPQSLSQDYREPFPADEENFPALNSGIRDSFHQGPRDNFSRGPQDNFQGPRDNFSSDARNNFPQGPRESFPGGKRDSLPPSQRDSFPPDPRDNFPQGFRENLPPGSRDDFPRGPRDNLPPGPRDDFPRGPRDNFPDDPRDGYPLDSRDDFSQGSRADFHQGPRGQFPGPRDSLDANLSRDPFPDPRDVVRDRDGYPGGDDRRDMFREREFGYPRGDSYRQLDDYSREHYFGDGERSRGWDDDYYSRAQFDERDNAPYRGQRQQPWESSFELEPATIVEYGHKPAAALAVDPVTPQPAPFLAPVQTFDYGHGSSSARHSRDISPPKISEPWHRGGDESYQRGRDRDSLRDRPSYHASSGNRWERERGRRDDELSRKQEHDDDRFRSDRLGRRSDGDADRDRDRRYRDNRRDDSGGRNGTKSSGPPSAPPPPSFGASAQPEKATAPAQRPILIEDLLSPPGRDTRPSRIVVILRGPPGSGKTFVAKLIKDKEVENGGSPPRILCLDDYFMVEVEKEQVNEETGRKSKIKVMEYEYEPGMEKNYRSSLIKAFCKTVNDNYFPFIIVDCVNQELKHFEELWSHAKQKGFQTYVCEMDQDLQSCVKRNIHNRTEPEISAIIKNWQPTPSYYLRLDVRSLLQSAAITEVEMEDSTQDDDDLPEVVEVEKEEKPAPEEDSDIISKWERMEPPSGEKLDRMDGLKRRKEPRTLEDWLTATDDYDNRTSLPGKKRVRWADLEEKRSQEKMRAIGFVVGQTDWSRMTDPTCGESALTQTKYI